MQKDTAPPVDPRLFRGHVAPLHLPGDKGLVLCQQIQGGADIIGSGVTHMHDDVFVSDKQHPCKCGAHAFVRIAQICHDLPVQPVKEVFPFLPDLLEGDPVRKAGQLVFKPFVKSADHMGAGQLALGTGRGQTENAGMLAQLQLCGPSGAAACLIRTLSWLVALTIPTSVSAVAVKRI